MTCSDISPAYELLFRQVDLQKVLKKMFNFNSNVNVKVGHKYSGTFWINVLSDCTYVTDGAGALIIKTKDKRKKTKGSWLLSDGILLQSGVR